MMPALWVHGHPRASVDTIPVLEKVLNIPQEIINDGDRAGQWGLPTLVALRYGLVVDDTQDERLNETACRQAAIRYLSDLYSEFGDWDLAYYAYLYSPAYVRNLQARDLSIPQPKPEIKRPPKPKTTDTTKATDKNKSSDKNKNKTSNKNKTGNKAKCITYTVKSGDTLSKIARLYHVTVDDIKKWNNLKNDLIRVNQQLKIYQ